MHLLDTAITDNLGAGVGVLAGGTFFALLGVIVTMRDGRQKRYDQRVDGDLERLRQDNRDLETENEQLEDDNRRLEEEVARLRRRLVDEGHDPGPRMVTR